MDRKKLIVSFSGGETSAFMAQWLMSNKSDEYEMKFVFANTGQENEETLIFVDKVDKYFSLGVVWLEAVVHHNAKKGCTHKVVNFNTARRNGEPFEDVISKYGIPNAKFKHCTRELKANPILSYAKSLGWKKHYTAIGIRNDEVDRMAVKFKKMRFIYPLISHLPVTKPMINMYWSQMPFRLQLKGYQGNCKTCFKKHDPKLYQIAKESPEAFNFTMKMECKYGAFISAGKLKSMEEKGIAPPESISFYRRNRTTFDIVNEAKQWDGVIQDDSEIYDESCEVFSDCGIDN